MMAKCRIAGDELRELFSLGDLYVSNFLKPEEKSEDYEKGNLTLGISPTSKLVQLTESTDFDAMYRKYWYNSGTNQSMTGELENIVQSVTKRIKVDDRDSWLDIGCNDGTLLSFVPPDIFKIGVDPSNSAYEAENHADMVCHDYFHELLVKYIDKCKVITAIAMFYDLEDPKTFLKDVYNTLDDDGLFVVQMSYLPLMIQQLAFDNICHEHLTYYSLAVLTKLFKGCGFNIVDCEVNDTNGGSFRVYAQKDVAKTESFGTAPFRDVASMRVSSLIAYEIERCFGSESVYNTFSDYLSELKRDVTDLVSEIKSAGKTIWGYGASTKGNTLLQYFGLDHTVIDGIAERQEIKYGLKTIGSEIPIYSESDMRKDNPDYLLLLPWHFVSEFSLRESEYLKSGGKFIVPCPKLEIISC